MKRPVTLVLLGSSLALLSSAAVAARQQVVATTTERFNLAAGGLIRIEGSYGNLNVEAWDRPDVEITVTKSTPDYDVKQREAGRLGLARVRIVTERRSDSELVVLTMPPRLTTSLIDAFVKRHQGGIMLAYEIHVPRESRLVIHHGNGLVFISGTTGDLDATSSRGDMVLMLPGEGAYSIDARCKLGRVTSDFDGDTSTAHVAGARFRGSNQAEGRRIHLRMGVGSIVIQAIPPEGEAPTVQPK